MINKEGKGRGQRAQMSLCCVMPVLIVCRMSTMAAMTSELDTKEGKAWPLEGATPILLL